MECELCNSDIDEEFERHFICPNCDSAFCEEEEDLLSSEGGLCPVCNAAYVEEVEN